MDRNLIIGVVVAALGVVAIYYYYSRKGKEKYANQVVHGGAGGIAGPISEELMYWPYDPPKESRRRPVVSVAYPPNDTCGGSGNIMY